MRGIREIIRSLASYPSPHFGRPGEVGGSKPRDSDGQLSEFGNRLGTNAAENIRIAQQALAELGLRSTTKAMRQYTRKDPVIAVFNNSTGEVFINKNAPYWKDPKAHAKRAFATHWFSTDNPLHPVLHEAGHQFDVQDNWNFGEQIAERVSRYAKVNPKEFVADVFAGLQDGRVYDSDVMRVYREYKKGVKRVVTNPVSYE